MAGWMKYLIKKSTVQFRRFVLNAALLVCTVFVDTLKILAFNRE